MENKNNPPDLVNRIVYLLFRRRRTRQDVWWARPWVLGAALVFVFTPSVKISEALESGSEFLRIDTDAGRGHIQPGRHRLWGAISYNPAGCFLKRRAALTALYILVPRMTLPGRVFPCPVPPGGSWG